MGRPGAPSPPPCPPPAVGSPLLLPKGRQAVEHTGGEGDGVAEERGERQAEQHGEHGHPARQGQPSGPGQLPTGCRDGVWPGCAHREPSGASSPAVEGGFLPGPQPVGPGGHGVGELDELAAERSLAQEQDESVEPPERAKQS